jgi:hypothetical protein
VSISGVDFNDNFATQFRVDDPVGHELVLDAAETELTAKVIKRFFFVNDGRIK